MILSGSASQSLATELATELNRSLAPVSFSYFPDNELLATAPTDTDHAIIVASTPTAETHIELLQLQDAVREAGTPNITTVIPYMGYARQDSVFEPGQPISARIIAKALSIETDEIVLVTPHTHTITEYFSAPTTIIDAEPVLADPLPESLNNPLFLAPDEGAISIAITVRDAYGTGDTDYFEKTRLSGDEVEITPSDTSVTDRDVILVDDIISTGGTMSTATRVLTDRGANRIIAACVHPVLSGTARIKLARAGITAVYGTDTLERQETTTTVAPLLADYLRNST